MAEKKEKTLEEKIGELNDLVEKLEKGDLDLQESLKEFENGVRLVKEVTEQLSRAEQKIVELSEDGTENEF